MDVKHILNSVCMLMLLCTVSCSTAKSQSKRDKKHKTYEEDLSSYRPRYDSAQKQQEQAKPKMDEAVVPSKDVTKKLNNKVDSLERIATPMKTMPGYRILVYSGKHSKEVQDVRAKVYENLPNANIYIEFRSPNQRVKVGDCIDRIEAYGLLGRLKKYFPNAVIIPDQITVK